MGDGSTLEETGMQKRATGPTMQSASLHVWVIRVQQEADSTGKKPAKDSKGSKSTRSCSPAGGVTN